MPKLEQTRDQAILAARVEDACRVARERSIPQWIGFLSPAQRQMTIAFADAQRAKYAFYGGHEDSERVFFVALPDWLEEDGLEWPFSAVTLCYRKVDEVSHRDVLGSLMALGIQRDTVGDILLEQGRCVVFVTADILPFVVSQLERIGRVGVTVTAGAQIPYPAAHQFESMQSTVSSKRLDCVIGSLCRLSRSKAEEVILSGLVTLNDLECKRVSHSIQANDRIAVRGTGKFIVDSLDGKTKKGRLVLKVRKYG